MRFSEYYRHLGLSGGWSREVWFTAFALAAGFGLMPVLIYFLGSSLLGRYEGASLRRIFENIYAGVQSGSAASWIVLLGPYGLYLIFQALRLLWRASAKLAS
jgi:hypothetical protein